MPLYSIKFVSSCRTTNTVVRRRLFTRSLAYNVRSLETTYAMLSLLYVKYTFQNFLLNIGIINFWRRQNLSSDNFYVNTKFREHLEIYNFDIHKKNCHSKKLDSASICLFKIEKFFRKTQVQFRILQKCAERFFEGQVAE